MPIDDIIKKSGDGDPISKRELMLMLSYPPDSAESYRVMAEANRISKELTGNQAEIHAQFALNLAPCKCNCLFCSFAEVNGVFRGEVEITVDDAVSMAKQFEADGANAIFMMTTAHYPFEKFIEISKEVRRNLQPETTLIANVGDQSRANAQKIKDAGYSGVYHALRLREGIDTTLSPERRREAIRIYQDAGLRVGTCVEPVGPEHKDEELVEMILYTASLNPSYSGAARRIAIPGTEIAKRGMISEIRMAQIVAITRLGMPRSVMGNCTHEPCTLGCIAGANLFWAEAGANPRDTEEKTENGRGDTVSACRKLFQESGWEIWEGPSRYYMN
ncbi:MAG: radical SAM protein [Desulfobacterales bacterium]